jgi:hypothetical protein
MRGMLGMCVIGMEEMEAETVDAMVGIGLTPVARLPPAAVRSMVLAHPHPA